MLPLSPAHLTVGSPDPTVVDDEHGIVVLDGRVPPGNQVFRSLTSSNLSSWSCPVLSLGSIA